MTHRIILRLPSEQAVQARTRVRAVSLAPSPRRSRRLQSHHPEFGPLRHDRNQSRSTSALPPANMEALAALFMGMQEQISSANCRVPKLNEHNYIRWKRDMSIYLKASNLWDTVIAAPPDPLTADWTRKNQCAVAEIHNCCEPA